MPTPALQIANRRPHVDDAGGQTRVDLAAAYRLVALFGWDDLVFTRISLRVPTSSDCPSMSTRPASSSPAPATARATMPAACCRCIRSMTLRFVRSSAACCRFRSDRSSYWFRSTTTTTKAFPCVTTRSRAWWPTWAGKPSSCRATTAWWTVNWTVADAFLAMSLFETVCTMQVRAMAGGSNLVWIDPRIVAAAAQQAAAASRGLGEQLTRPSLSPSPSALARRSRFKAGVMSRLARKTAAIEPRRRAAACRSPRIGPPQWAPAGRCGIAQC